MAYDATKPVTGGSLVAADMRENFRALKEDDIVDGITRSVIAGTGLSGGGQLNTDRTVNHVAHTGDVTGATALTIGAAKVSQAKLKTSTHEQTNATGEWVPKTLTYADYGFECRFKHSGSGIYAAQFARGSQVNPVVTKSSAYVGETMYIKGNTSAGYFVTAHVIYRYVTSSGEVFWLWILRDKITKKIISVDASSDHCSFGKKDPSERPHPFDHEYDPAKHEIVLINPTETELKVLYAKKKEIGSDSLIETFLNEYEINETSEPQWPTKPVTTKIINDDWFEAWINKEPVEIKKKVIPKVDYVLCRKLILK